MRVVICTTGETMAHMWKKNTKTVANKRKIIENEDQLMHYLSKHGNSNSIVCLEDIWAAKDTDELKEMILAIRNWHPEVSIFLLSQCPTFLVGKQMLELGIKGYANARMLPIHFLDALTCIEKGDVWVYPEFVQMMIKTIHLAKEEDTAPNKQKLDVLSPREKEVAELIYQGRTNKEIASIADITLRTVKAHTSSIYEKLQVKDRVALVLLLKSINE